MPARVPSARDTAVGADDKLGQTRNDGVMQLAQRQALGMEFPQDGKTDVPGPVYLLVAQVAHARRVRGEHAQAAALPHLHVDAVAGHQAVESGLRQVPVAHGKVRNLRHPACLRKLTRHGHHDDILLVVSPRHLAQHRTGTRHLPCAAGPRPGRSFA
ncbi:hypothetical protein G6F65_021704 [Rhizopus arrhizus]|nr:hypothetical protein G6F65_021704 [Rhizopus arrhizus]